MWDLLFGNERPSRRKGEQAGVQRAVALQYGGHDDFAPLVAAKGNNEMASEIIAAAKEFGIPIVRREELAEALADVPLDEVIPEHLYQAVALVLTELNEVE